MSGPAQQELRSINNRYSAFAKFLNITRCTVGVYWIDYQGKPVLYKRLAPQVYLDVNTFVTHPWIFIDEETKTRLLCNGRDVFFPEPWFAKYQGLRRSQLPQHARIERTTFVITSPMPSLRTICLRLIKRLLRNDHDAYSLELPRSLQRELFVAEPRKPQRSAQARNS